MSTAGSKKFFDGTPADPYGATPGAAFGVSTYYIPIPFAAMPVKSLMLVGDGTAVASAIVQHTDMDVDLDGTLINPRVVGNGRCWKDDAAIGTLSIAASTGATGSARVTFSNASARQSRIVLTVTVGGRILGFASAHS